MKIKRWIPSWGFTLTIFCFWLLLVEGFGRGQVVMAALLAFAVPLYAARLDREFARMGSLKPVPKLAVRVLWDIVASNIHVARLILGPQSAITPGFIWVPLKIDNIHGIAALTSIITLTPGTVSASLSDDRKYLLVHCLDVKNSAEAVRQIKARYEAPLLEIFP